MLRRLLHRVVPLSARVRLVRLFHRSKDSVRRWLRGLRYAGKARYCHACQRYASRFLPFDMRYLHVDGGIVPSLVVEDTCCPHCGAHLHHRLLWRVLPGFLPTKPTERVRLLHFAPEAFSLSRLRAWRGVDYITTDFMRRDVDLTLDMCLLGLADASVDMIVASHVLEHVQDDRAALRELFRVLRNGGKALLLVPLFAETSYEYPNIVDEAERLRLYGQKDHVRAYGLDFAERVRDAGFSVQVLHCKDFADLPRPADSYLHKVQGVLFVAHKPLVF